MRMSRFILAPLFTVLLFSCSPPEVTQHRVTGITFFPDGELSAVVYCQAPGYSCASMIFFDQDPIYNRALNTFYADFATDNLAGFFNKPEAQLIFRPEYGIDQIKIDKIINKTYEVKVTGDSSIVLLRNPKLGLQLDNIMYAFERTDKH